jgi:hypothetical protein
VQSHRSAPSGDWELEVTYCFRDDGTLAALTSELRTFQGDVIIQHSRFFRPNGETLQDSKEMLDLNRRRPLRGKSGNYMDRKLRVYQKAEDVLAEVGRDRVYP